MVENLIKDLAEGLGQWAYLLVASLALAETAAFLGFIAPGEFAIIFGGVLAGEGTLSIELLIGIVWASAVAGDAIGFQLGRRFGRNFAVKYGRGILCAPIISIVVAVTRPMIPISPTRLTESPPPPGQASS